jgi:dihydrofolate reductase
MAPFWAESSDPMAGVINALPKKVFSATDTDYKWSNSEVSHRSVEEEIPAMKEEAGGDIVCFGGAKFAHSLVAADLIDEYRLAIHPVVFGDGLPLWLGLTEPRRFFVVNSNVYADGVVSMHFTKLEP